MLSVDIGKTWVQSVKLSSRWSSMVGILSYLPESSHLLSQGRFRLPLLSRILLPPFPKSLYCTYLVFPPCLILFPSDPVSLTIRVVFVSTNWSSFTGERGQVFQTVWNYLEMKRHCVFRPSRLWIYACCSKQPRCYRRLWREFWVRYKYIRLSDTLHP